MRKPYSFESFSRSCVSFCWFLYLQFLSVYMPGYGFLWVFLFGVHSAFSYWGKNHITEIYHLGHVYSSVALSTFILLCSYCHLHLRTFSSSPAETLYLLKTNSPYPFSLQTLATTFALPVSMNFTVLGTSY